jgi:antirestriction protein ArdC
MAWKTAKSQVTEHRDHMQELVNRVAEIIESTGKLPLKREWDSSKCVGPQSPFNAATGEPYHGINVICLGLNPLAFTTADPRFCTYKQAEDKGWQVKKGSKATGVFFFKPLEIEDEKAKDGTRIVPILRHYSVFHASEIEGVPAYTPPTQEDAPWTRPEAVSTILKASGVKVLTGGDRAFYSPAHDFIQLPPDVAFFKPEYWSATAIHELNHATGHASRMNRDMTGSFGSEKYCQEEARVELAASCVCNTLGLPTDYENSAAYVAGWLKKLRSDKRELFHAAADAQRIASWTLAYHPDFAPNQKANKQPDRPALTGSSLEGTVPASTP